MPLGELGREGPRSAQLANLHPQGANFATPSLVARTPAEEGYGSVLLGT